MAQITRTGAVPTDLTAYLEKLTGIFKQAFGQDLATEPETPQGQLIALLALGFAQADEAVVQAANGLSVSHAFGSQLDQLGSLLGITRIQSARSTVAVTLGGEVGSTIPAGAQARTTEGDVFELVSVVFIGGTGQETGEMRAVVPGPVAVPVGALNQLVTLTDGWETVTNPLAGHPGRLAESDVEFRARYHQLTARNRLSSVDAIRAALWDVEGVTKVRVDENDTALILFRQSIPLPPHSVTATVQGGSDADIARALEQHKTVGTQTNGHVVVLLTNSAGIEVPYRFNRATPLRLFVTVTTRIHDNFPADGIAQIKQRLVDYAAGTFASGNPNDFDRSGFAIGEDLDGRRLLTPVHSVAGHTVTDFTVVFQGGQDATVEEAFLGDLYTLAAADITVTIAA